MPPIYTDRTGRRKIITSIMVDADLFLEFKLAAAHRHRAERGYLSTAIEEAMRLWLDKYTSQGTWHSYPSWETEINQKKKKFGIP